MSTNTNNAIEMNVPANLAEFRGQFVVFFPDASEPQVLFHSYIAKAAHDFASVISAERGVAPVVHRVPVNDSEHMAQVLALAL